MRWPWTKPNRPASRPKKPCKRHLGATVYGHNLIGWCTCTDCGNDIPMTQGFNDLLDEIKEQLNAIQK